ncbi:MAG: rare lipoprotein A [Pseudohongiellaceae bacterium]|jgi:rare lipoprotein A
MRFQIVGLLVVWLSACSTSLQVPQLGSSKDGQPTNSVDVTKIANAKPAAVVRTRAGNAPQYTVLGKTYRVLPSSEGYQRRGEASWYGTKFHGRRTANGEVYNMFAMTAAHTTLPIPSYVRVTHVANGRSVIVRINDRGPFHGNRIIDLSYVAAKKLGMIATGFAAVDVVDVTPAHKKSSIKRSIEPSLSVQNVLPQRNSTRVYLQLGAFQQFQSAETLRDKVSIVLSQAVNVIVGKDNLHRVFVGPFNNPLQIASIQDLLRQRGISEGHIVSKGIDAQ